MSLARYQEALDCGFNKREAGMIGLAEDIAAQSRAWREENEAFAADIGSTMEELRAEPVESRPFLQDLYAAWLAERSKEA